MVHALGKAGFEIARIKGSHHFLQHRDGRATVVPVHAGETLGPGLMSKILRDTELTRDELSGSSNPSPSSHATANGCSIPGTGGHALYPTHPRKVKPA